MTVEIRPAGRELYHCFRIHLAGDGEHVTSIRYRPDTSVLKIDRTRSGSNADVVHTRSLPVHPRDGRLKLRILMDRFSVEIFANDGETAASMAIFTRQEASAISFDAEGPCGWTWKNTTSIWIRRTDCTQQRLMKKSSSPVRGCCLLMGGPVLALSAGAGYNTDQRTFPRKGNLYEHYHCCL